MITEIGEERESQLSLFEFKFAVTREIASCEISITACALKPAGGNAKSEQPLTQAIIRCKNERYTFGMHKKSRSHQTSYSLGVSAASS